MKHIKVRRILTANGASLGELTGLSRTLYVLEDEWRNNQRLVSCIPTGIYKVVPHGWEADSPVKFKRTWRLLNVPGRSAILIHVGNYHQHTQGCLLAGMGMQVSQTLSMVNDSGIALELMRKEIGNNGFMLTIQ